MIGENSAMPTPAATQLPIEHGVNLRTFNSFGLPAQAHTLVRVDSDAALRRVIDHPDLGRAPKFILGGGSNVIFARDPDGYLVEFEQLA